MDLIDWDTPPPDYPTCDPKRLTCLEALRLVYGVFVPGDPDAARARAEYFYRCRLVQVANRAVLRDTLRRKALTP